MDMKIFVCVVILCISFCFGQNSCSISNKIDCGYSGINQQQCNSKGCCWVPVNPNPSNEPWCFFGGNHTTDPTLPPPAPTGAPFSSKDLQTMYAYFIDNIDIDGLGGVVASPDNSTPGGTYFFHWERDGALSMNALQLVTNFTVYNNYMPSYVKWVLNVQNEKDPNGIDVRVEPKYNLPYGDVYSGSWCRPQTDGPGLRAITLITYANTLLAQGNVDYVKQYLWTGSSSSYNGGAIKYDLDWIVNNWQQNGCDLWEEIQSNDFFWNRFTMKHSLLLGSSFASAMGDTSTSQTYYNVAETINATIINHWNGQFIYESTNREEDSAVILGLNDGYSDDGFFSPTDPRVVATINTFNSLFYFTFAINTKDSENGVPGILYGRYQGDTYAGGNPWILTSASLAQLFYRGATGFLGQNAAPDKESLADWQQIFERINGEHHSIHHLKSMSPLTFSKLVTSAGDAVLDRIKYHTKSYDYHMSEQLDRNTGAEVSATDLTWSYATILKAMWHRNNATATAMKQYPHLASDPFYEIVSFDF